MFTTFKGSGHTDLVRTSLDGVAWEEYDLDRQPDEVRADDPLFFRQKTTDKQAYIDYEAAGPGGFNPVVEDEDSPEATIRTGNRVAHVMLNFKKSLAINEEMMEDDQWGAVQEEVRLSAMRARTSRDDYAFRNTYGDAFSGATTNNGTALCSNTQSNLNGDVIDNLETGVLNADNLEALVNNLRLQKGQDGKLGSYHADGLLGSVSLAAEMHEVVKSDLKAGTGNNDLNYFSKIYPGLRIGTSAYLSSTYNTLNANVDTSYFVVSRNHNVNRIVRVKYVTEYVEPKFDGRGRGFYRMRFRELTYPTQYNGVAGSNGTV